MDTAVLEGSGVGRAYEPAVQGGLMPEFFAREVIDEVLAMLLCGIFVSI